MPIEKPFGRYRATLQSFRHYGSAQEKSKIIREDSPLRGKLQKLDDRIDPARFPQVVAGIRESLPEILNGLNSGVEKNSHEIGQGHCFKEILDADGRPAQKFGNLTTLIGV